MKTYEVVLLYFRTPVHFGDASEGGGLGDVIPFCRADTFFSALCNEAAKIDTGFLAELVNKAESGKILLSDLMPWHFVKKNNVVVEAIDDVGRYNLYIPRPLLTIPSGKIEKPLSFTDTKCFSTVRKELKKRIYVRASQCNDYIMDIRNGIQTIDREPEFGKFVLDTHYNSRTKKPYDTGSYYFNRGVGLYIVLAVEDKADLVWLKNMILSVGLNGIGGRRSSGSGKYEFETEPFVLSDDEIHGLDATALYKLLDNDTASIQMTLSSVLPLTDEIGAMQAGTGKIIKRSGFANSIAMGKPLKENSIYMMAAGSCFKKRHAGTIVNVNNGTAPHPVYKYGKGLYVGLTV